MSAPGPPILIAGMHRSGTTLLVDLLREAGCFFGSRLDENREAYFFLMRNEWLLRRAGGAWDRPLPAREFLERNELREGVVDLFRRQVHSPYFSRYTGYGAYLAGAWRRGKLRPWGWKDPRNTFTLPVWEEVFPGARLVYVRRNGVDVASSLVTRALARLASTKPERANLFVRPFFGRLARLHHPLESFEYHLYTSRCFDLEQGFRLWEEYVEEGQRRFEAYSGPKLAVSFERLLEDPAQVFPEIASFCGVEGAALPAGLLERVDPARATAFLERPELREFYATVRDSRWMQELGYGDLS